MPQLSWTLPDDRLQASVREGGRGELTSVRIHLDRSHADALAKALAEIAPAAELRNGMTASWTFFWKLRDGESRLLLAHPESRQWVATLALTTEDRDRVVDQLRQPGEFPLSRLAIGWQSNLDVVLVTA